jgi:hypothetical protein
MSSDHVVYDYHGTPIEIPQFVMDKLHEKYHGKLTPEIMEHVLGLAAAMKLTTLKHQKLTPQDWDYLMGLTDKVGVDAVMSMKSKGGKKSRRLMFRRGSKRANKRRRKTARK